jgi:hypothetical protein
MVDSRDRARLDIQEGLFYIVQLGFTLRVSCVLKRITRFVPCLHVLHTCWSSWNNGGDIDL